MFNVVLPLNCDYVSGKKKPKKKIKTYKKGGFKNQCFLYDNYG